MAYEEGEAPQSKSFKFQHTSGQRFNEVERLEKAWDTTIDIVKEDLGQIENRRRFKSMLKWVDSYLYPLTKDNQDFTDAIESLRSFKPHTLDEETNQMYDVMKLLRMAQTKTKLSPPKAVSWTIKWGEPTDCPIVLDTQRILREQGTTTVIFIGPPGSGKSFSAVTFNNKVNNPFPLGRCFFETEDFFNSINTFIDKDGNPINGGDMLMWEEIGIAADNREFMSLKNKVISKALDVWRKKNLGLCLSMPSLDNLDSRIENRLDWILEVKDFNKKPNGNLISTTFNVLVSQHNPIIQKTYRKHPIYTIDGEEVMLNEITIYAPPEDVIAKYNALSDECKSNILKALEADLANAKAKKTKADFNMDAAVEEVRKHINEPDWVTSHGNIEKEKVIELLGVGAPRAIQIVKAIGKIRDKNFR